jgi:hypothetical protein
VYAANTAQQVLELAGVALAERVAAEALQHVQSIVGSATRADVMIVSREGEIMVHAA